MVHCAHVMGHNDCKEALSMAPGSRELLPKVGASYLTGRVDLDVRSTAVFLPGRPLECRFRAIILRLLPALEHRFRLKISSCEKSTLLRYGKGDHYSEHVDSNAESLHRKLSVVLFLTGALSDFRGGQLVIDDTEGRVIIPGTTGTVTVFDSCLPHQVMPVEGGLRIVMVTWLW